MKTTFLLIHSVLFLIGSFIASPYQLNGQSSVRSLIDSTVIGYAYADLELIDPDKTLLFVKELLGSDTSFALSMDQAGPEITEFVNSLKKTGGKEVFLFLSLRDILANGPFLVLTSNDENQAKAIAKQLEGYLPPILKGYNMTVQVVGRDVLIANKNIVERVDNNMLPRRNDWEEFTKIPGNSELAVVIAPSMEQLKVIREAWLELPEPFDGFTGEIISDGAARICLRFSGKSANTTSGRQIDLRIEGLSAETNKAFAAELKKFGVRMLEVKPDRQNRANSLFSPQDFRELIRFLSQLEPKQMGKAFAYSYSDSEKNLEKLLADLKPVMASLDLQAQRQKRESYIRELVLAAHTYHDAYKSLPPTAIVNEDGKPLLSWRVLILPFIEEGELYSQFKLDEPWDSEHNKKLIPKIPKLYVTDQGIAKDGKTTYVIPTGNDVIGSTTEPLTLEKISDGTSRTILIMDVSPESAVIWTKPEDWEFEASDPTKGLFAKDQTLLLAGFADGSVRWLENDVDLIKKRLTYSSID